MIEYSYFILTLCNTDLECQEILFSRERDAREAADRLNSFLPKSLIHSVVLEGVLELDVGNPADEDGYVQLEERRIELKF